MRAVLRWLVLAILAGVGVAVALALSVVLMFLIHVVQRAEELLLIDCQAYCQEHLLLRLYDPQPVEEDDQMRDMGMKDMVKL